MVPAATAESLSPLDVEAGKGGRDEEAGEARNGVDRWLATARVAYADFAAYCGGSVKFYREKPRVFLRETVAGLVVAIMQLPESIAFSYVAGVPPLVGLQSTFILGLVCALIGGKPAMISGAAGAMAVVAADLTSETGPVGDLALSSRISYLFTAMFLCGILQVVAGALRLGALAKLIPATAMMGFMNGLAIIIFLAQLPVFKECNKGGIFYDCSGSEQTWLPASSATLWLTLAVSLVSLAIMFLWPRVGKVATFVPAPLVCIAVGTVFEHGLNRPLFGSPLRTIGETAPIEGDLPTFRAPWREIADPRWGVLLQYGFVFAAIGLVESVMTLQAVNELTKTIATPAHVSQECVAQGVGNFLSSVLGGMGGDTMIGQSAINIRSGARGRLSGAVAAVVVMLVALFLSSLVNEIPVAVLAGILFAIVISTFNWSTFRVMRSVSRTDAAVIVLVTAVAVVQDLAVAILLGVCLSAVSSVWNTGRLLRVDVQDGAGADGRPYRAYTISGTMFFASTRNLLAHFDVKNDPDDVYLDMRRSIIADYSAIDAVRTLARLYHDDGKHLHVIRLCARSSARLSRHLGAAARDRIVSLYQPGTPRDAGPVSPHMRPARAPSSDSDADADAHGSPASTFAIGSLRVFNAPAAVGSVDAAELELERSEFVDIDDDAPGHGDGAASADLGRRAEGGEDAEEPTPAGAQPTAEAEGEAAAGSAPPSPLPGPATGEDLPEGEAGSAEGGAEPLPEATAAGQEVTAGDGAPAATGTADDDDGVATASSDAGERGGARDGPEPEGP